MKISCTNLMVPGNSITEKAHKLRNWGFDAISLQVPLLDKSEELEAELEILENNTGIHICEFSYVGDDFGSQMGEDQEAAERAIDAQIASILLCGKLGAGNAIGFEYKSRNPLPLFEAASIMPDYLRKSFVSLLNKIGKTAKEQGVEFTVEAINRYETRYVHTLDECRSIIDDTDPVLGIGILADFFHMSIEEANIEDAIRKNGNYIKHVHLGENNRLLPGHGTINWGKGIRALKSIGYQGYIALECGIPGNPETLLPECAMFLKDLIRKA